MIKDLYARLKELSDAAPKGIHVKVCKNLEISGSYSKKIRAGSVATEDNWHNNRLLQSMIWEYEKLIREVIDNLIEVAGYD